MVAFYGDSTGLALLSASEVNARYPDSDGRLLDGYRTRRSGRVPVPVSDRTHVRRDDEPAAGVHRGTGRSGWRGAARGAVLLQPGGRPGSDPGGEATGGGTRHRDRRGDRDPAGWHRRGTVCAQVAPCAPGLRHIPRLRGHGLAGGDEAGGTDWRGCHVHGCVDRAATVHCAMYRFVVFRVTE